MNDDSDSEDSVSEEDKITLEITELADFKELMVSYTRTYFEYDGNGMRVGEE